MKNMKKIITIALMLFITHFTNAQDSGNELKNFRFGLKFTPSVNWYKPEDKIIVNNGPVMKYGGGMILEFRLAKVISLQTGLQIDVNGGKVKYNNGNTLKSLSSNSVSYFYNTQDDKIVKFDSTLNPASYNHYQINSRSYSITYITVPISFKMKTNEIGMFTYYGQFGINNSFRWKAMATDEVQQITSSGLGTSETKKKIDVTKDVSFYTASLIMGAGAEMNLSGSTSFTFGLSYNLGFTNVVKNDSDYLRRRANDAFGTPTFSKMPQKIKSNAVVLTVGVLF
jgi:Outer membrane protein beta-barrel domain